MRRGAEAASRGLDTSISSCERETVLPTLYPQLMRNQRMRLAPQAPAWCPLPRSGHPTHSLTTSPPSSSSLGAQWPGPWQGLLRS